MNDFSGFYISIIRQDIVGKNLETPKCVYQQCGYSDGANVLTLLAFFDDGRYFASLPKEVQNYIGRACFEHQPNLFSLEEIKHYSLNAYAYSVADVILHQRREEITAGVVAKPEHIAFLMELKNESDDELEKVYASYERFSSGVIVPIDEYYFLLNSSDSKMNSMQKFVDDFIKTYNIKTITKNELNAFINSAEFSDENLEKAARIQNTLVSQYSRYCENDKIDEYQREVKFDLRKESQFHTAEEVKKYPMDNELLDILKNNKCQNELLQNLNENSQEKEFQKFIEDNIALSNKIIEFEKKESIYLPEARTRIFKEIANDISKLDKTLTENYSYFSTKCDLDKILKPKEIITKFVLKNKEKVYSQTK